MAGAAVPSKTLAVVCWGFEGTVGATEEYEGGGVEGGVSSLVSDMSADSMAAFSSSSSACRRASAGSYSGLATVCVVISGGTKSLASMPCCPRLSIIFCSNGLVQCEVHLDRRVGAETLHLQWRAPYDSIAGP